MFRQALKYGAALIALYLVVANSSGFGTAIDAGAKGGIGLTKALQGRS
ncbi:hypothetical protein [Cellulomonas sp. 73-145]|nr:hypothetical protein [Cellulomonas sp. 73-145]MBN9327807.1 hypothetical protein [Cellulomonas sp.]